MDASVFLLTVKEALERARTAQRAVANLSLSGDVQYDKGREIANKSLYTDQKILDALDAISETLANSYRQIVADFEDGDRMSWAGTTHEIRELLRKMLEQLAPAQKVEARTWYKQELGTNGPTQKQRVRYILETRNGDSKQQKVAQDIDIVDERTAILVRDLYGRASDAAHRAKNKAEAYRILRYFEAFAYDLLDIE